MSVCACPPDQSGLCDDCTGLVEHLDHRAVRVCAVEDCRKPLVRKPGEREHRWRARDYCNRSCYLVLRRAGQKPSTAHQAPVEKVCAECGTPFRRGAGERLGRWLARECCGKRCAQRRALRLGPKPAARPVQAKPRPAPKPQAVTDTDNDDDDDDDDGGGPRYCLLESCRQELTRRPGEELRRFRARRFCSGHRCAMRYLHTQNRDGAQEKTCPGCGTVFGWPVGMPPAQWRRKTYCSQTCGGATAPEQPEGPKRKPKPKAVSSDVLKAAPADPAKPVVVWRPAGFSRVPNEWAGHRPPPEDQKLGVGS